VKMDYEVLGTCIEFNLGSLRGEYVSMNSRVLLSHQDSGVSQVFNCAALSSLDQVENWLKGITASSSLEAKWPSRSAHTALT
jgi:hypothetical protein